ncbi:MAG: regulatory iron-sulfur-containing complex subunit RicT [Gemmatimonadales bacterium]|nr:regulatory iron-sulfur-containing complex subunit RicT [Gemmatimonadales bacterium]
MPTTVEVRFKGNRKDYFLWPEEAERLYLHQPVIVEAERGLDFGRVGVVGETAAKKCAAGCSGCAVGGDTPAASRPVIRVATQDDVRAANDLRRSEEPTRIKAIERVRHHGLDMKLSDAEWQWDRKKLTFYFTAEKRVDFRDLVRDLASAFKTRIELRQIGVRDEAARLGGVGRCGKEYCCSTWLRALDPVSLALAKDQHLSLNPAQISGGCGRLLCCLKYEHEFYVAARKRFPKEGKLVRTLKGAEKVVAVDIFRERVFLRGEDGPRIVLLADLREEMAQAPEVTASEQTSLDATAIRPGRPIRPPRSAGPASAAPTSDRAESDRPPAERGRDERGGDRRRDEPRADRRSEESRGDRGANRRPDEPRGDRGANRRPDEPRGERGANRRSDEPRGERRPNRGPDQPRADRPRDERGGDRRDDRQVTDQPRGDRRDTADPTTPDASAAGGPPTEESRGGRPKRRRRRGRGPGPRGNDSPPTSDA